MGKKIIEDYSMWREGKNEPTTRAVSVVRRGIRKGVTENKSHVCRRHCMRHRKKIKNQPSGCGVHTSQSVL